MAASTRKTEKKSCLEALSETDIARRIKPAWNRDRDDWDPAFLGQEITKNYELAAWYEQQLPSIQAEFRRLFSISLSPPFSFSPSVSPPFSPPPSAVSARRK
jgi:hypothetical protein